jgi:hypothetical protein
MDFGKILYEGSAYDIAGAKEFVDSLTRGRIIRIIATDDNGPKLDTVLARLRKELEELDLWLSGAADKDTAWLSQLRHERAAIAREISNLEKHPDLAKFFADQVLAELRRVLETMDRMIPATESSSTPYVNPYVEGARQERERIRRSISRLEKHPGMAKVYAKMFKMFRTPEEEELDREYQTTWLNLRKGIRPQDPPLIPPGGSSPAGGTPSAAAVDPGPFRNRGKTWLQ